MKDVYNDLQKKFNRDFQYRESFPVCSLRQLAYYEELLGVCWRELRSCCSNADYEKSL